jgi:hypothetical protein
MSPFVECVLIHVPFAKSLHPSAAGAGRLRVRDDWVSLATGALAGAPGTHRELACAWEAGWHEWPAEPLVRRRELERRLGRFVVRTQAGPTGLLVDHRRGAAEVRCLWWVVGDEQQLLLERIAEEDRIERVGDAHAVWVVVKDKALRWLPLFGGPVRSVPLPGWLSSRLSWSVGAPRNLVALPDQGVLVFSLDGGLAVVPLPPLEAAMAAEKLVWRVREAYPLADLSVRMTGEVVWGNLVTLENGDQTTLPFSCPRGEKLTFVGRLSANSGAATFLFVERDGKLAPLAPAPRDEEVAVSEAGLPRTKPRVSGRARARSFSAEANWLGKALRFELPEGEAAADLVFSATRKTPGDGLTASEWCSVLVARLGPKLREGGVMVLEVDFANETDDVLGEFAELVRPLGLELRDEPGVNALTAGKAHHDIDLLEVSRLVNARLAARGIEAAVIARVLDTRTLFLAAAGSDLARLGKIGLRDGQEAHARKTR